MEKLTAFVNAHLNDDTTRLILDRTKWPEIDMDLAVSCIESRRKLRGKVQEWYDEPGLIFPYKLSAEQCSSSATGRYKAELASRITSADFSGSPARRPELSSDRHPALSFERHPALDAGSPHFRIADLTGGLGVDSWFFSQKEAEVLYNEMQPRLCEAATHNFKVLGRDNIHCSCAKAEPGNIKGILNGFEPDIIFMDPARRGEGGRKVFLLEDCTPDVLTLKDEIFAESRHILLKLSPMADITMACNRLGRTCREVHIVATAGECKELLIWLDREWNDEYMINAVELPSGLPTTRPSVFSFTPSEEKSSSYTLGIEGRYLFEPGKALMKSGAFSLISERMEIRKLGHSTHYYLTDDETMAASLMKHGKIFEVLSSSPLDKRSINAAAKDFPKAEVTSRNIPMDTDTLRKKLGTSPSDEYHIFGLKSDINGAILLITKRITI